MRFVNWTLRLVVFLILVAFAAKNTEPATLRFYFGLAWQAPLVVLLLAFFTLGAVLGLLATVGARLRHRREIAQLRREARKTAAAGQRGESRPEPKLPPVIDG
jgi:lipopolysaccharide assembly protein A